MITSDDVVDICSSDDEKIKDEPIPDKSPTKDRHNSAPYNAQRAMERAMLGATLMDRIRNEASQSTKENSDSTQTSHKESKRKLQVTVKDTAKSGTGKSTKIVIKIDEGLTNEEKREANRTRASKRRLYGFQHKDEDFTDEFIDFLELCLKYEFSDGMMRILNRSIIPYYKEADKNYIQSEKFKNYIEIIIKRIKEHPERKFSALKDLCDNLKAAKARKRVKFTTLDNHISDERKRKLAASTVTKASPKRMKCTDIVDLDKLEETPVIDLESSPQHDNIPSDDIIIVNDEKENCSLTSEADPPKDDDSTKNNPVSLTEEAKKNLKIRHLEEQIKSCKERIKSLDQMEVSADNIYSPYIQSDHFKAMIVKLYKEILELRGENATPRSKTINLIVREGHPSGPAKKLEQWLNGNTDDGGEPVFPNFLNVVKCVSEAIAEEGLSWSKEQILTEARMLFTECGQLLQKRRQKREWRDLVCKVEDIGHHDVMGMDPADQDPLLLKRLQENKSIARRKEAAIIEEYAQMKPCSRRKGNNKIVVLQEDSTSTENKATDNLDIGNGEQQKCTDGFEFEVPITEIVTYSQTDSKDTQEVEEEKDVKPNIVPKPINPDVEILVSDSEDYSSSEYEDSDFELDDVVFGKYAATNTGESNLGSSDFCQSIVISNVVSESTLPNVAAVDKENECNDQCPGIKIVKSESVLQTDYESTNKSDTTAQDVINAAKSVTNMEQNVESASEYPNLVVNYNDVFIKTEPAVTTLEETLKLMQEFANNSSGEGITVKTTIIDIDQEPIFYMEISSDSESDSSDDETCNLDSENCVIDNGNCEKPEDQ